MVDRFRKFETDELMTGGRQVRQLIIAVTANEAECEQNGAKNSFDQICIKPLTRLDICHLVNKYFPEDSKC